MIKTMCNECGQGMIVAALLLLVALVILYLIGAFSPPPAMPV